MAETKPRSRVALAGLSGVGATKLERYGAAFLEVVREVAGDVSAQDGRAATGPADDAATPLFGAPDPGPGTDADDGEGFPDGVGDEGPTFDDDLDTVERTRELLLQGYAPEAAAGMRNLKVRTVEGHLAELVRRGDLTVEEATGLTRQQIGEVEQAYEALPDAARSRLKPLFEALGGRYTYAHLKCVLAALG
jgi:ATP-dependent DNA helicase RecQ